MTIAVKLQVEADLRNLPEFDGVDDYLWARTNGIDTMTVFSDESKAAENVHTAIRLVEQHGVKVLRVYEDRVGVGDIQRRLGDIVSRQAVAKWVAQDSFPKPRTSNATDRGSAPLWDWADVVAWLQANKNLATDQHLRSERCVAEINAFIHGCTDYASASLLADAYRPVETNVVRIDQYLTKSYPAQAFKVVVEEGLHIHGDFQRNVVKRELRVDAPYAL